LFPTNGFVYSPRVMSLSAGTNLIYQCPAGKCAVNLPIPNPSFVGHAAIVATYMNDSGTSRSVTGYVVSSGAVPDTSNREFLNRSVTDDNQTFLFGGIMFPGDYIVFSTDASTATQWIRLTVAEIPFP